MGDPLARYCAMLQLIIDKLTEIGVWELPEDPFDIGEWLDDGLSPE